jgi:hypothetical protein
MSLRERSWVEVEAHRAALGAEPRAHRSFFYSRTPLHLGTLPTAQQYLFESEGPTATAKLTALKAQIAKSGHPFRPNYPNTQTLCDQVLADLSLALEVDFGRLTEENVPEEETLTQLHNELAEARALHPYLVWLFNRWRGAVPLFT